MQKITMLKNILYISLLLFPFSLLAARPPGYDVVQSISNSITVIVIYSLFAFMGIALGMRKAHIKNNTKYLWGSILFFAISISFIIAHFSTIYEITGIVQSNTHELTKNKNDTLYFSVVTWTTLGYGDFYPSEAARKYAGTQALLGYLYMGLLVSLIIQAFTIKSKNA